jgi:hypothetical protein
LSGAIRCIYTLVETRAGVARLTKRAVVVGEPIVDQVVAVVINSIAGFYRRRDVGTRAHHTTAAGFGAGRTRTNTLGASRTCVTRLRERVVGHIAGSRAGVAEVVRAEVRVIARGAPRLLNVGSRHNGKAGSGVTVVVSVFLILAVARLPTA